MRLIYTLLFALITFHSFAQDFYDLETIQTIEITFAESNWDQLMDIAKASDDGYVLAQSATINGVQFDSVGVKYKGNSSYNANQIKNPWHIELDTYKDQEYDGYTDIKLASGYKDPSMLRDVLGYQILRQYMEAPQANYANLYVNGTLIGLYANTESISKKFMGSRFNSKENTRFKCSPPDGAGPQSNDLPELVYLGQDSTDYYDAYELKSDAGWQDLIDLCDTLANHTTEIENILDVNRTLWMLAFDNVTVNLDSYIGNFSQNYYLYKSDQGQFLPVVWDLNESFGVFSQTGSSNLNGTQAKQRMSHLLHENDSDFPLVQKLLGIPTYKKMYLAHIKTMLLETFDSGLYIDMGESLQATIDAAVQADNNKFFTYNNFLSNLTSDVSSGGGGGPGGGGGNSAPGITNLMDGRTSYLLGLTDFTQAEPVIEDISLSNEAPQLNEQISLTASIENATQVYLKYRATSKTGLFTKVEMFDDGLNNDGAANDGIYGATFDLNATTTEYYIYAENENIGKFSPRRAEFEFYEVVASIGSIDGVVVNEFMASNDTNATDPDGEFEDWIELYNNGSAAVDLSGYYLTDNNEELTKWAFPEGTIIEPDGYLIIWADEDLEQEGLHADFKLSASGESVILVDADGSTIINSIDYPEQTTDVSYARIPNGTGDFEFSSSTFSANNNNTVDCSSLGGDADNDGICADLDCDDNDASVGESQPQGTLCDDGDDNTQNDVILADGCTCAGSSSTTSDLVINELLASNDNNVADQDGEFEDWIELYNNGSTNIDLSGYYLSDDNTNLTKWAFPAGTSIVAGGYLIIWADEDLEQTGLHADFKLSAGGESVILVEADGTTIVDAINYPEQSADVSYGRFENGTGPFQLMDPTFNGTNTNTVNTQQVFANSDFEIFPNPGNNFFYISIPNEELNPTRVMLRSIVGKLIQQKDFILEAGNFRMDLNNTPTGTYLVQVEFENGIILTNKLVLINN